MGLHKVEFLVPKDLAIKLTDRDYSPMVNEYRNISDARVISARLEPIAAKDTQAAVVVLYRSAEEDSRVQTAATG